MRNSKTNRFLLGITILFSIFLFQGSDSESCGGSDSCSDEILNTAFGYVNIYNHTVFKLDVSIFPLGNLNGPTYGRSVGAGQIGIRVAVEAGYYGAWAYKVVNGIKLNTKPSNVMYFNLKQGETVTYHVY